MYEYKAFITRVVDGDTVDCKIDVGFDISVAKRVRLFGIDAPETRTRDLDEKAKGLAAKDWLESRILNKYVIIKTEVHTGKFGRVLGTIWHDGVNLNDLMLEEDLVALYE